MGILHLLYVFHWFPRCLLRIPLLIQLYSSSMQVVISEFLFDLWMIVVQELIHIPCMYCTSENMYFICSFFTSLYLHWIDTFLLPACRQVTVSTFAGVSGDLEDTPPKRSTWNTKITQLKGKNHEPNLQFLRLICSFSRVYPEKLAELALLFLLVGTMP